MAKLSEKPVLSQAITRLKGVGPRVGEKLKNLKIETLQDVLFHLPLRYEDRTRVQPVGGLQPGHSAVIDVEINHAEIVFTRKGRSRRMLLCHVSDGTGHLLLRFFYFNKTQQQQLTAGTRLRCFGDVRLGASCLEITHPEYSLIHNQQAASLENNLTPVYPACDGVSQFLLRRLSDQVLALLDNQLAELELLPDMVLKKFALPSLKQSLKTVHRPAADIDLNLMDQGLHPAQQRLAMEELLAQHLSLQDLRRNNRRHQAIALQSDNQLQNQFIKSLPFKLTGAQQKVQQIILADLKKNQPMMRLIQGDVGSGKTIVAILACLKAIEAGYQAAIMAPTEILAEQHFNFACQCLQPLGLKVAWLSGKLKSKQRREMLQLIASGEASLVVGTHALFQDEVVFHRLALIVIDEQHRFGVHQRLALRNKGADKTGVPHQLIMTATPIPRSLAMTAYGDLEHSIIDELPPGRTPVKTIVLSEDRRGDVIERVQQACRENKQVYWVCTLVEESEALQCQAAEDTQKLLQQALSEFNIGLVHGRMKPAEKQQVMADFKHGKIQLLVATTVIEVGVDVPNASLMIIENAERLGLSQLHQLRGRVGRGSQASHCVLMYKKPLSQQAKARLAIMRETNDGFEISRRDLQIRGPGEVLGTKQTGLLQLRIADIVRDEHLLDEVKQLGEVLQQQYPRQVKALIRRWLGDAQQYGHIG